MLGCTLSWFHRHWTTLKGIAIVYVSDTRTSILPLAIALDITLSHILTRRLQLAQGNLPVAPDPNPHGLELAASVLYQPVNLVFSEN
jgi:hypothetical protein